MDHVAAAARDPAAASRDGLDAEAMSDTVIAAFDGRCGHCQEPICEGDPIVLVDDEWLHEECAEEA